MPKGRDDLRAESAGRLVLPRGGGSVGRCLIHWATGPLQSNRSQLTIGKRASSKKARACAKFPFQKYSIMKTTYLHVFDTLGSKVLGKFTKHSAIMGPAGLDPASPAPVRERSVLWASGAAAAQPIASARTHTHTRTHRDKRKACCTHRAQNIARQLKSRREDAPEQVAVFSECFLAASPPPPVAARLCLLPPRHPLLCV